MSIKEHNSFAASTHHSRIDSGLNSFGEGVGRKDTVLLEHSIKLQKVLRTGVDGGGNPLSDGVLDSASTDVLISEHVVEGLHPDQELQWLRDLALFKRDRKVIDGLPRFVPINHDVFHPIINVTQIRDIDRDTNHPGWDFHPWADSALFPFGSGQINTFKGINSRNLVPADVDDQLDPTRLFMRGLENNFGNNGGPHQFTAFFQGPDIPPPVEGFTIRNAESGDLVFIAKITPHITFTLPAVQGQSGGFIFPEVIRFAHPNETLFHDGEIYLFGTAKT